MGAKHPPISSPRSETGGPGTFGCGACTWTNASSEQQNTKKLKGRKVTASNCVRVQLGQIMNKIQRDQTPNCHFLGARSRSRCTTNRVGRPSKPHLWPKPWTHPYLPPFKGPVPPGSEQGRPLVLVSPSSCSTSPRKALPEFLVWPLNNSC